MKEVQARAHSSISWPDHQIEEWTMEYGAGATRFTWFIFQSEWEERTSFRLDRVLGETQE
jgi:hypothetical protein